MIDRGIRQRGPSFIQHRSHARLLPSRAGERPAWQGVALWVGLTAGTAIAGMLATFQTDEFYAVLAKPGWAPPGWLFGPMWSLMYLLMAGAAVLVLRGLASRPLGFSALGLYALALIPAALWSWAFFRWQLGVVSLVVNIVLWGLLLATLLAFRRVSAIGAALMVPVLLWVSFALVLNAALLPLNPSLL